MYDDSLETSHELGDDSHLVSHHFSRLETGDEKYPNE